MLEQHLEKLLAFQITAKEQSFLGAANILRVTQPAVTKSIKQLEESVGTSLFIRHSRGVRLTEAGKVLNQFCESFSLRVRDIEKQIRESSDMAGVIKIGTYETLGELFWPKALRRIKESFPKITVELSTQHPDQHWNLLENGGIDIIVDAEPRQRDQFHSTVLYRDRFGLYCSPKLNYTRHEGPVPLVIVERAFDRNGVSISQHLTGANFDFVLQFSVESFTMVRSFIAEGICVGALPHRLAHTAVKEGLIVPFSKRPELANFGEHRICATTAYDLRDQVRIKKLIAALKENAVAYV